MKCYGLSIESDRIHLLDPRGKSVIDEPNVVIVDKSNRIIWGERALDLARSSASTNKLIQPFKNDIIEDFNTTTLLLQEIMSSTHSVWLKKPAVIASINAGSSRAEKQAFAQTLSLAGFGRVALVPKSILALLGSQYPLNQPSAQALVDLGMASSEFAITCYGDILHLESTHGSDANSLSESIYKYLYKKHRITISESAVHNIIMKSDALHQKPSRQLTVRTEGQKTLTISSTELRPIFTSIVDPLIKNILSKLSDTPSQVMSDVIKNSILLSGRLNTIKYIDKYFESMTGIKFTLLSPDSSLSGIKFIQRHFDDFGSSLLHKNIITLFD